MMICACGFWGLPRYDVRVRRPCLGLFIAAAISFALGLHLTRRINGLVEAAEAVAFGDYSRKVQVNGSDEIALLASHFNLMARSIQLRIADISELNLGL